MKKYLCLSIIFILHFTLHITHYLYGEYSGTRVFEFLKIDTTARPAAMGGAFVGIADDINALNYNPAGLGLLNQNQISFMHNRWFQSVNQEYLAYSHNSGVGVAINYLNYGNIQETTISNPRGLGLGEFKSYDAAANFGYGNKINKNMFLGFSLKYVKEKISEYNSWAVASEFGCLYITPIEKLTAGLVLKNISTKVKFIDTTEELPLIVKTGVGYKTMEDKLTIGIDIGRQMDNEKTFFNTGAEYLIIEFLALRCGINTRNETDTGITGGFGVNYCDFNLDYAYSPYGDLGDTHKITLTYKFAEKLEKTVKKQRVKNKGSISPIETLKSIEGIKIEEKLIQKSTGANIDSPEMEKVTIIIANETTIKFEFNSAEIKNFSVLDKIAKVILQNPRYIVEIIGHTDSVGEKQYNIELSQKRAENVMKYFVGKGIPQKNLTARGVGYTQPISPNDTPENQAKNRRVEIILH